MLQIANHRITKKKFKLATIHFYTSPRNSVVMHMVSDNEIYLQPPKKKKKKERYILINWLMGLNLDDG